MGKNIQILQVEGLTPDVPPAASGDERVRIDPGLRNKNGKVIAPEKIHVSNGFEVASLQDDPLGTDYGTFDVQNMTTGANKCRWVADAARTIQHPIAEHQSTLGINGAAPSPLTPLAFGMGGGGEANIASNQGVGGVGVFETKTGIEFEFRNIIAKSNKIDVTHNIANKEIEVDAVESSIVHQNLSGAGVQTHAQIDAHVANIANPHSVTKAQVSLGNVTNDAQLKRSGNDYASIAIKASPLGADVVLIEDSADSNNKKKALISSLPSSGEANTASNQGAGASIVKGKSGVDLEFNSIDGDPQTGVSVFIDSNNIRITTRPKRLFINPDPDVGAPFEKTLTLPECDYTFIRTSNVGDIPHVFFLPTTSLLEGMNFIFKNETSVVHTLDAGVGKSLEGGTATTRVVLPGETFHFFYDTSDSKWYLGS